MKKTFAAVAAIGVALLASGCSSEPDSAEAANKTACMKEATKLASSFPDGSFGEIRSEPTANGHIVTARFSGQTSNGTTLNRDFSCTAETVDGAISVKDVDWEAPAGQTTTVAPRSTTPRPTTSALTPDQTYTAVMEANLIPFTAETLRRDKETCTTFLKGGEPATATKPARTPAEILFFDFGVGHPEHAQDGSSIKRAELMIPILCPTMAGAIEEARSGSITVPRQTEFRDGKYLIGQKMLPGTYTIATPVSDCYWERSDGQGNIIDNNFISISPSVTVTIGAGDAGFTSRGCGTWKLVE